MGAFKRTILLVCGMLCVGLGVAGIFLPLLPTTPFLLLAAFLFSHSSPRWHQWLLDNPHFGTYIKEWQSHRTLPRRAKVTALLLLAVGISTSVVFVLESVYFRGAVLFVGVAVGIFLVRIRST